MEWVTHERFAQLQQQWLRREQERYEPSAKGIMFTRKIITRSKFITDADETCAICMENIEQDSGALQCCRHTFHWKCIDQWVRVSAICPVCRRDVTVSAARTEHTERNTEI